MKKLASLLLSLLLTAALAVPALADVIWEPMDDFYTMHRDECVYLDGARYEAQADTQLVKTPEDLTVVEPLPAGSVVYANYIWQSDDPWAAVEIFPGEGADGWREGWVRLADFRRLYGEAEFISDHADELFEADGGVTVTNETPVILWTFPGSGETNGYMGGPDFWLEEETASFGRLWTDEDGGDWAQISYFYGHRGWVYLPDPGRSDLPRTAPRYADGDETPPKAPDTPAETAAPAVSAGRPIAPVIAVVIAIAAVTAVLIAVFTRRRRPGE